MLSQAVVGDAVPPRERAHYQGYLAAVAVSSSTFGPVAGGFLTEHFGWQSVFLVNLPIGLLAIVLAVRLPKRPGSGAPFRFDLLGVLLFAVRSEEHTSELQSLMRISYAVFCLKKKTTKQTSIKNKA